MSTKPPKGTSAGRNGSSGVLIMSVSVKSVTKKKKKNDTFLAFLTSHARTVVRECCKGDDKSLLFLKKLNSLKHLERTTVAESHN